MARRRSSDAEDESPEEIEAETDETESDVGEAKQPANSRGPQPPRLSITLPDHTRKKLRLAAALEDMEPNEWAKVVLVTAARKTVARRFPDKV